MKSLGWLSVALVVLVLGSVGTQQVLPADPPKVVPPKAAVLELFEDDADLLIPELVNESGDNGTATREDVERFTGVCSLKVTPLQRYTAQVKGWHYKIKNKPELGEYRFVRFAWKKAGGGGIMIQFCGNTDATGWEHRYVSGPSSVPWATRELDDKAPVDWKLVTCDLIRDFGSFILTGIAFTPMDNQAGYYDHIYLGRTVEELDKVTEAARGKLVVKDALTKKRLDELWTELNHEDALVRVPAAATLRARPRESVPYLREKLYTGPGQDEEKQVATLIQQLDDDEFRVRDKAQKDLAALGDAAVVHLRRALQTTTSAEVRERLERLLAGRGVVDSRPTGDQKRTLRALRILEQAGTPEARQVLEELAKSNMDAALKPEVRAAVKRLPPKP